MNTLLRTRTLGLAALALTASMSLAACGDEADTGSASEPTTSESSSETPTESETPMESEEPMAAAAPFGPGCAGVPTSGEGSVEGEDFTVDGAAVVCGNVPVANATVYVVDQVLMPKM